MGNTQTTDAASINSPNQLQLPQPQTLNKQITTTSPDVYKTFPYTTQLGRLLDYEYFNNLLLGQHFEAFSIRINAKDYTADYSKIRYIAVNFAGLLSRIMADMLFSEPVSIKASDVGDQEWIDAFIQENRLNEQLYESALTNSALGDDLFKLRIGKRHKNDSQSTIIFEETTPTVYFPQVDGFNVRAVPDKIELAWTFAVNETQYLRKEIHEPGMIENHVYEMKGNQIMQEVNLNILNMPGLSGIGNQQQTRIQDSLVIHIPNWKTGNRHFGISDYYDLDKLFYAINNRISKIDNILDKHSDPILMVPDGVLDENGKVKKEQLHMIEVPEGQGGKQKPEYIVWNANLDAAFSQAEKLVEYFMMTAEITPDVLGMGTGMNDSGRALKFKLMRTIAKAQRKKLYYDRAIKEIVYRGQCLSKEWGIGVGPDKLQLKGDPERPDIIWQDGLPIDDFEQVTNVIAKIDAGLESKKDAIMELENIDEQAAEEKLEEIDKENPLPIVGMNNTPAAFGKGKTNLDVKTPMKPVNDNANSKNPAKKK